MENCIEYLSLKIEITVITVNVNKVVNNLSDPFDNFF